MCAILAGLMDDLAVFGLAADANAGDALSRLGPRPRSIWVSREVGANLGAVRGLLAARRGAAGELEWLPAYAAVVADTMRLYRSTLEGRA